MKKLNYNIKQRKKASTLFALTLTEIEAANSLIQIQLFRESVVHLYFASFYISQALLLKYLTYRPRHKAVDAQLHKIYGRKKDFPRRYLDMHSRLHQLRTEVNYRSAHTPEPSQIRKDYEYVVAYYNFAHRLITTIDFDDILRDIVDDNKGKINDFSLDIYCPQTYSHHVRFTAWFPPFYLDVFKCNRLAMYLKSILKKLRVRRCEDYVAGLNSKLDQYSDQHLLMIDIDSLDVAVEATLKKIGGILFKSGRGFHFLGRHVIKGRKEWHKSLRKILRNPVLKHRVDRDHIEISMQRGYSTLRITTSPFKTVRPQFFKEF